MTLLETELYPSNTDPLFNFGYKDLYSMVATGGPNWSCDNFGNSFQEEDFKALLFDQLQDQDLNAINNNWEASFPSIAIQKHCDQICPLNIMEGTKSSSTKSNRRKRRRTRSVKNQEEIENQRRTHIAVERNRRKQMNDYLANLRSLMPPSYVPRGDQASIIGGAINFVKELEQLLQTMEGHKKTNEVKDQQSSNSSSSSPLAKLFAFPECSTQYNNLEIDSKTQNEWAVSDVQVTMVDSHANIKIMTKKRPKQLLRMVVGFQSLMLSIFHLNVTTVDQMVLYSVSVKIEEDCQLNTVDEIAAAVNQMMLTIQEESAFS